MAAGRTAQFGAWPPQGEPAATGVPTAWMRVVAAGNVGPTGTLQGNPLGKVVGVVSPGTGQYQVAVDYPIESAFDVVPLVQPRNTVFVSAVAVVNVAANRIDINTFDAAGAALNSEFYFTLLA